MRQLRKQARMYGRCACLLIAPASSGSQLYPPPPSPSLYPSTHTRPPSSSSSVRASWSYAFPLNPRVGSSRLTKGLRYNQTDCPLSVITSPPSSLSLHPPPPPYRHPNHPTVIQHCFNPLFSCTSYSALELVRLWWASFRSMHGFVIIDSKHGG